jgi:peptide/nickel transport system permease protein
VLTVAALDAGALVSGALVTETVFARPGMGKLIYDAVMGNDYNLALLALLLVALVTMLATLAADLGHRALDPRIRD